MQEYIRELGRTGLRGWLANIGRVPLTD